MAGPGGGPPRRSHTKSRKGCETCKRRHIRCDESFPQCRNCTKHKIRCPYNDLPVPEDRRSTTPDKPDLMWTPEIMANIEHWRQTGLFPFPDLPVFPAPDPTQYTVQDLRLIYHLASICSELEIMSANTFTLWTRQIPALISIAATHHFVMEALLAFSAMHIASLTDCPVVGNLSYEHRGVALSGLQEAISNFSRESSDAILAASLVLSWQATEWRSWVQLMQGTSTVIEAMDTWKEESQFIDFINESCTFPTAPPSPNPDRKPTQLSQEDLEVYNKTLAQLHKVEAHLKLAKENNRDIQQLITFLKGSRKVSPSMPIEQQFERLRPLRTWLFNLPVMLLQQTAASPNALLVIAHYYTVALLMERMFPEIGAAYFGSLSIRPVEEIARQLYARTGEQGPSSSIDSTLALMEVPIATVTDFRARMGFVQPPRTPSFPQFSAAAYYPSDQLGVVVTEPGMPYGTPSFSYSHDSLNVLNTDCVPAHAVSPLRLSSPFPNAQFLGVPSPSYGAYSPASSTFDEPPYFEADQYGPYDMDNMHTFNMYGGGPSSANFGGITSTSNSPMYPPTGDPIHASGTPSPFMQQPDQMNMLPMPESPLPSTSVVTPASSTAESPGSITAPQQPRQQRAFD